MMPSCGNDRSTENVDEALATRRAAIEDAVAWREVVAADAEEDEDLRALLPAVLAHLYTVVSQDGAGSDHLGGAA